MDNGIYKIKIKKTQAGKLVPFSLVYLFPADMLPQMRRAFATFFGFPVRHQAQFSWDKISVDKVLHGETRAKKDREGTTLGEYVPDLFRKENPWHVAVPVANMNVTPKRKNIAARDHNRSKNDPRELYGGQAPYKESKQPKPVLGYIQDWRWSSGQAYPKTAYLATREKIHAPICATCPRYPLHMNGKCTFGDAVCFETFREYVAPNMFSKLREYDEYIEKLKAEEGK